MGRWNIYRAVRKILYRNIRGYGTGWKWEDKERNRATAYKSCFTENVKGAGADEYRPIFWLKQEDKEEYERYFNVQHSDCYTKYGLKRTGCAGCPFGKNFEYELEIMKKYEPKLYKAALHIFGASYEYTRAYKKFVKDKEKEKRGYEQLNLFEQ